MAEKKKKHKKKAVLPSWVRRPFEQFLQEIEALGDLVSLSAEGISRLRAMPTVIDALMTTEPHPSESKTARYKQDMERAKKQAALAKSEIKLGFPVLHGWAVVALWAHLESLIRVFVASWLKHRKTSWQVEPIQRLKIKIGEFVSIPKEQQHTFVAELLERDLGAKFRSGVTRFEALLDPFGLSGDLPNIISDTIYEFGQVRNLIAHRASKVDRQFVQACPWLDVRVGTNFHISQDMLGRYFFAAEHYVTLLIYRVQEKYGMNRSTARARLEGCAKRNLRQTRLKKRSRGPSKAKRPPRT